ncbi:MAG: hypothetical protein CMP24_05730 [Rickettsiales bacterium]|nr:hypothetical protein [Rickettsiales bacterium]
MEKNTFFIKEATVDESNLISWNPELEQERNSALFDLINTGFFKLKNKNTGPYKIKIRLFEWKLFIKVFDCFDNSEIEVKSSLSSIRRTIRDYQIVCENYIDAIKTAPLKKIEAIDVGRRTIHDEGAILLQELVCDKIEIDIESARRLFTLISIISSKI